MKIFRYLKQYLKISLFLKFKKSYKKAFFIEQLTSIYIEKQDNNKKSLDIGCGLYPKNPFNAKYLYGVDLRDDLSHGIEIKKANLIFENLPYETNQFDFVTAFDCIEHIPRIISHNGKPKNSFIDLMNEIYRVLKPNGIFFHKTPAFPSSLAFQDPTHLNFITENTFPNYFCLPNIEATVNGYGFSGKFQLLDQKWFHNSWILCLMRVVKDKEK